MHITGHSFFGQSKSKGSRSCVGNAYNLLLPKGKSSRPLCRCLSTQFFFFFSCFHSMIWFSSLPQSRVIARKRLIFWTIWKFAAQSCQVLISVHIAFFFFSFSSFFVRQKKKFSAVAVVRVWRDDTFAHFIFWVSSTSDTSLRRAAYFTQRSSSRRRGNHGAPQPEL